jgi:hypothetical protein
MTGMRRAVPSTRPEALALGLLAALLAALSSGCYLSYGLSGGDRDAAVIDATVTDSSRRDAGTDGGGGPIDSGLYCPLARADYLCLGSFLVQPGRAFQLPLSFATCGCCINSECAVSVDSGARTLELTTTLCPDPCDCSMCVTPTVSCEVPALDEGDWRVNVNGAAALTLPVYYDTGVVPPPPACVHFAEPSACAGDATVPGILSATNFACAYAGAPAPDAYVIEVTDPCGGCAQESTCTVRLEPRYTDDLPPGGELYVNPNRYSESCVDCLPVCARVSRTCQVPPLVSGDTYRVHVEGVPPFTFVAGSAERICAGEWPGV